MLIRKLRTNHIENPVGFALDEVTLSYIVESQSGSCQKAARIQVAADAGMTEILYDSGMRPDIDSIAWVLPMELTPAMRYYWNVTVETDAGETATSETAYFETAMAMDQISARFIEAEVPMDVVDFFKAVTLDKETVSVRAYATALGVYDLMVDGRKVGDEYLAPYSNDYDSWLQVQTYDLDGILTVGSHEISMLTAPGWYSGYFGFEGKHEIYGKEKAAMLQIEIIFKDGSRQSIMTDESWRARENAVRYSEIYHGEVLDMTFKPVGDYSVHILDVDMKKLSPRRSLPVRVMEKIEPAAILHTPAGETVLDMGQNMAGWPAFICREPQGTRIHMQVGETLQGGNFYRDNLRAARAEFTYISDGTERMVRPHFTYYGFRYVKLEGFTAEPQLCDFSGEVIYSEMDVTGSVETDNPLVNRLALNALWGQKSNFVDVPSDCPQRDERLGWTGDAQVFSGTALFNMDAFPFYSKFGYDMLLEQEKYDGCVPMVIPSFHMGPGGASAWADCAVIIPWNTYLYSGDKSILKQQYPSMKMWADYIHRQDEADGGRGLWQTGFQFGDWLALDGEDPGIPTGATDPYYVSSAYYYLSTHLTGQAAHVLGYEEDAAYFDALEEKIRQAMRAEYFTDDGELVLKKRRIGPPKEGSAVVYNEVDGETVKTQTGYVLALAFGFCPEEFKAGMAEKLNEKIKEDGGSLMTGFVGTPSLCPVLSENGFNHTAYSLLLAEGIPSWLYCVTMGATTIWERWNSIMPDGSMNPEGMNSLNHYAYGSIEEWMYRYMGGINPIEEIPGFREIRLTPMPDPQIGRAKVSYDSPVGTYVSAWSYEDDGLSFHFEIPFGGTARLTLPAEQGQTVLLNGINVTDAGGMEGKYIQVLKNGIYDFCIR